MLVKMGQEKLNYQITVLALDQRIGVTFFKYKRSFAHLWGNNVS